MHLLDVTLHGPRPDATEIQRYVRHGSSLRISPGTGTAPSRPGVCRPLASFTELCRRARGEAARFNGARSPVRGRVGRADRDGCWRIARAGERVDRGHARRSWWGLRLAGGCREAGAVYSSLLIVSRDSAPSLIFFRLVTQIILS
jgi:hypothetical protein